MALINCPECSAELSSDAVACPRCGKPNKKAVHKKQNSAQGAGVVIMVVALPLGFFSPLAGVVAFVVGLVIVMLNTRLW